MVAVRLGETAYVTKAPPWSKKMFKMGRLGFEPGRVPPHLRPYLLKKGDVRPIVEQCRAEGKGGVSLVKCIFTRVGLARAKK